MALQDQLNRVNCGSGDVGGTGLAACQFDWGRIISAEFSPRNFRYTEEITLEYIQEQQKLGNLIIVNGYESFTQNTPDPTINTVDGSGYKQVIGELPTEFSAVLNNGVLNWKALRTLNGKDNWNVVFTDVNGTRIMTETKQGAVKGFGLKMLYTGTYKGVEGNNPSMYTQLMQFSDYMEMDRMAWIENESLDFSQNDVDGLNDVILNVQPISVGDTKITLKPTLADKTHPLLAAVATDFLVTVDGVPTVVTLTYVGETIELTITAATSGQVYTVDLIDTALAGAIGVNIAEVLYKSEAETVAVF